MTYDGVNNTYVYDAWNRLVQVKQGSSVLDSRSYYADLHMASSSDSCAGVTTESYYSSDWQVLEDDTNAGSGMTRMQYVWGKGYTDQLVARDDNSTTGSLGASSSGYGRRIFAVQDVNHDVTALVDVYAVVLQRFAYDPYGSYTSNSYGWVYQFQGGRMDPVAGLYNFRNRDYNVGFGVWMEQDPAGYRAGSDVYTFNSDSPGDLNDPFGLAPTPNRGPIMGPALGLVQIELKPTIKHVNYALEKGNDYAVGETIIKDIVFKYHDPNRDVFVYGPTTGGGIIPGAPYFELGGVLLVLPVLELIANPATVKLQGNHGWAGTKGHGVPYVMLHESMHAEQATIALAKALASLMIPITTPPGTHTQADAKEYFKRGVQSHIKELDQIAKDAIRDNDDFYKEVDRRWNENNTDYGGITYS